jgi:hypothetical protein
MAVLPNGKVLVVGGIDGSSNAVVAAELYDPANTNTPTMGWSSAGSLITARYCHAMTVLGNDQVLVAGGATRPNRNAGV